MRRIRMLSALSALALGLAATATTVAAEKPVALIIAQGGLGDKSITTSLTQVSRRACRDKLDGKPVEFERHCCASAPTFFAALPTPDFGLIVDLEYSSGDALKTVAKEYPNTDYVDPEPGRSRVQRRFDSLPGAGRLLPRRRARDDGRDGFEDQGHDRKASDRRHRRYKSVGITSS